jgi:hypothetical protein
MSNIMRTDKEWQAYYDAKTLIEAAKIKNDSARKDAAKTQVAAINEENIEALTASRKVLRSVK